MHRSAAPAATQLPFPAFVGSSRWGLLFRAVRGVVLVLNDETRLWLWRDLVIDALRARYGTNERTAAKVTAEAARLFAYLRARGASCWADVTVVVVTEWCWAARVDRSGRHRRAAPSTARNRQWVARATFEEAAALGAPVDARALVGERIARPSRVVAARALTFEEAEAVRAHADAGLVASRRSVAVALSFAGATATECARVRGGDIDIAGARVRFGGDAARWAPLDGWSAATLARFFANNPSVSPGERVCVTDRLDTHAGAHSVSVQLAEVIQAAGIAGRAGVTARSIRLASAKRILEAEGIASAARFLGLSSLDSTADALGWRWGHDDD